GVEGEWRGHTVRLGRAGWCRAEALPVTATYLCTGEGAPRAFTFTDRLRPGAAEAVALLRKQGKQIRLISGDTEGAVASLAERLGITDWIAGALPAEKAALVTELTAAGRHVLMVGDGLNDTAALAAADVSISPASALDAARVASDIVLLGQDMAPIADAARIAGQTARRIRENFAISALYNLVAVPLALVGAATPLAAALAMSLSSISVTLNALRLK
ncbi:MAG: HAD-IC family P-type ATPase, partial [Gemmobacter sp.]|nr:HAD-IC family P-type ATPase [Gemmobacter sp.]